MSTYKDPENIRSAWVFELLGQAGTRSPPSPQPALLGPVTERSPKEVHLPNHANPICPITASTLMVLSAANAWIAQVTEDYAALFTGLCLCVCAAAGLFGEDLL